MCLIYDKDLSRRLRRGNDTITVYKRLILCYNGSLNSIFYTYDIKSGKTHKDWRCGWNISSRKCKLTNTEARLSRPGGGKIHEGFHVYLEKPLFVKGSPDYLRIVEFTAKLKDFIGAGHGPYDAALDYQVPQAVFTKLHLSCKEFDKARQQNTMANAC